MGTCVYQLTVFDVVLKQLGGYNGMMVQPQLVQASIIATIRHPALKATERAYLKCIRSCLEQYRMLNTTIRLDQILSNLTFATNEFANNVSFRPLL